MEKTIERQRVVLHHLRSSSTSSSLKNIDSSLSESICVVRDSAAYHRSSVYGDAQIRIGLVLLITGISRKLEAQLDEELYLLVDRDFADSQKFTIDELAIR
ncbi:unnamed protein product [Camellia sinensis]